MSPSLHRRAFVDVCNGFSIGSLDEKPVYVKHLTHFDHEEFDTRQAGFEQEGITQGNPTEKERVTLLLKLGMWSPAKDNEIARQKDAVGQYEEARKGMVQPSIIVQYDRQIADERAKLNRLESERIGLIGMTVETYAQRRLNDHYILSSLFSDAAMTAPLLTDIAFESLPDSRVNEIHDAYNAAIESCGEANLRRLAVQDLFQSYYALSDSAASFYGKPIVQLTYYQVRLANYGRYYRSLLDNMDSSTLTPAQRNDPDAIERIAMAKRNQDANGDKVPTQLTSEDIKAMGLEGRMAKLPGANMSAIEYVKHIQGQRQG